METKTENKVIGDKIITKKLSSGMKCYIIPKAGYGEKMAALCVRFGSNDICCQIPGKEKKECFPLGTAHFIEHKLFEQEWGDAFRAFSENAASANAYTDFQKTVYYFSCRDYFEENMALLFRFVQNPYFTEEGTENEKKIIGSEITMYDDDPDWIVYFHMLQCMYHHHSIQNPIAGSIETISEINKETLQRCYEAFYTPENFSFVCVGDVDATTILEQAEGLVQRKNSYRAKTVFEKEPEAIKKDFMIQEMGLSVPIYQIGFKQKPQEENKHMKKSLEMRLVLDIIAGDSSDFFAKAYKKEYLDEAMGYDFTAGDGFAFTAFRGTGNKWKEVSRLLLEEIDKLKNHGLSEDVFQRTKEKHLGRMIRGFNSVNAICMSQLDMAMKNTDLFESFQILKGLKLEEAQRMLQKEFKEEQMVISVIK